MQLNFACHNALVLVFFQSVLEVNFFWIHLANADPEATFRRHLPVWQTTIAFPSGKGVD